MQRGKRDLALEQASKATAWRREQLCESRRMRLQPQTDHQVSKTLIESSQKCSTELADTATLVDDFASAECGSDTDCQSINGLF